MLILILLPLCLLTGLGGCIDNSTTNPSTADPVVPDPDKTPVDPDPITPPEETFGPTSGLRTISSGGSHNCSIKNLDGSLWCWGNNEDNELGNSSTTSLSSPLAISTDFWQTVVAGDKHSCGIDEDGALHCWGKNDSGQVGNGTTITQEKPAAISANTDWRDVSLGSTHSCAIKNTDDSLWCWGSNTSSQLGHSPTSSTRPSKLIKTNADKTTTTEQWSATANGATHTCAIKKADKSLWCWGGNDKGQLGQGTISTLLSEPTELAASSQWLSIAANGNHSCAIKTDTTLWCWGDNSAGQVGNNSSTTEITTPAAIASGSTWNKISLGSDHSCGIQTNGSLWCWGDNTHSKLGDNTTAASLTPKQIGSAIWREISLGDQFSCGIQNDNSLWCWGSNTSNQQGHLPPDTSNATDMTVPTSVDAGASSWSSLSSGDAHSCAIKTDETLWCWGSSAFGQAAQTSTTNTKTPTQEPSNSSWLKIAADGNYSCAVRKDSSLWCWGNNTYGQLGNGSIKLSTSPAPVLDDSIWIGLSLGVDHSCAIKDDKTLWCWGDNSQAQLGDDSIINSTIPKQIGAAKTWSNISLGNQFSCGIQTDATPAIPSQTLWCWGKNDKFQRGHTPLPADEKKPSQVGGIDWSAVSAGNEHACAIKNQTSNQYLYCWGDNSFGQQGLTPSQTSPTTPVDANKWLGVSAGGNHTCAIQADNTLWCWGDNDTGQLGIGNTSHQPKPNQVIHSDALDWRFVSSGKNHTCAIDSDYIGHCWGLNDLGQLGNGINLNTTAARLFDTSNNWLSIDSGTLHSCGIKTDPFTLLKTLWCGGINDYGQLGIASTANQSAPIQIKGPNGTLEDWEYVSTGHFHSCAITETGAADNSGALYCWGRNSHSQLATANTLNNSTNWSLQNNILPPAPDNTDNWIKVDAGASHTCGIKNTSELWCWGDNSTGQIGNGGSGAGVKVVIPFQIIGTWLDVAVGGYTEKTGHIEGGHTCAIQDSGNGTNGTLWCWGENDASQLGDQTIIPKTSPTQIIVDTVANGFPPQFNNSWVSVKAGNRFTCGLQTDQHLYCWGDHSLGQTGIGTIDAVTNPDPTSPRLIEGNHSVIEYAVGQNTACAITSDNKLWCWGENFTNKPTIRLTGSDWQSLTLGLTHGCGIREDATTLNRNVYCWGEGAEFQFGDGSAWKETPQALSLQ